ncbi:hypothetical protein M431DRAFT_484535 [Trichoderma harzianum CBS 226.95]|uniref:Uncharacterized protein n=1 Tax=Trichoderma harzianum CBS 226.95 TaxID=983964 RepID=A0A2T4A395_TRIHA|nr:hypothetical protein M431DRAFT_484535 [Trichoderma harzianum CBS 226.95]PTB51542.1 hypothetical protein M431DRAFT_484535 [Trichoderma harzianum CBS 226.95]
MGMHIDLPSRLESAQAKQHHLQARTTWYRITVPFGECSDVGEEWQARATHGESWHDARLHETSAEPKKAAYVVRGISMQQVLGDSEERLTAICEVTLLDDMKRVADGSGKTPARPVAITWRKMMTGSNRWNNVPGVSTAFNQPATLACLIVYMASNEKACPLLQAVTGEPESPPSSHLPHAANRFSSIQSRMRLASQIWKYLAEYWYMRMYQ